MKSEIIIDNKNFSLWYYPENKIIHHKFHDYVYGSALRSYLHEGVKVMKDKSAVKWLSDDRENPTLSPEDVLYGKDVWVPAAIKAGWKYWDLILPAAVPGKSSMTRFLDYVAEYGVVIKLFQETDEAIKWLQEQ